MRYLLHQREFPCLMHHHIRSLLFLGDFWGAIRYGMDNPHKHLWRRKGFYVHTVEARFLMTNL